MDNVTAAALLRVRDYCATHASRVAADSGRSLAAPGALAAWDERFVRLEPGALCELASAAYHLEIKPLVDLTCQAIAQLLKGKSPAEIRRTFNILYDFAPGDDVPPPTTRDKLRTKLSESTAAAAAAAAPAPARTQMKETRSVDELLSFIDEPDAGKVQAGAKRKKKKKKKKKKPPAKKAQQQPQQQHQKDVHGGDKEAVEPRKLDNVEEATAADDDDDDDDAATAAAAEQVDNDGGTDASGEVMNEHASDNDEEEDNDNDDDNDDEQTEQEILEFQQRLFSINVDPAREKISLSADVVAQMLKK